MDRLNTYSRKGKLVSLLALIAGLTPGAALALPEGLEVRGGSISVNQPDATTLVIQQGTQRAAGDWRSFNIGAGERVNIQQPSASSLMLARVSGGVGTEIFGQLNANGALLLLNPHGVLIGPGAVINTASFAAGTLTADPNQFMQGGALTLQPLTGAPADAAVINRGTISVSDAGLVALVAPQVINEGLIHARLGTIQLAAGTAATLDLSGDGLLQVALDPAASGALLNQGQLKAQMVRIGAAEAQALIHAAVNLDGLVEARGADDSGGTIVVASAGDVIVKGQLDASGGAAASGGNVKLLGNRVALLDQALVNASGGTGGGEVLIGGNKLGQGPEPNATVAVMAPGSQVQADARVQGDGGRVILWSDDYTGFYGTISARGGSNGGNGGFVETSSKLNLQAQGSVEAGAPLGQGGLWLLDPADVSITDASDANLDTTTTPGLWAPTTAAGSTNINAASLISALQTGDIKITSASSDPSGVGSITIAAALAAAASQTGAFTLTLEADDTSALIQGGNDIFVTELINLPYTKLVVSKASNFTSGTNGTIKVQSFSSDVANTTTIGATLETSNQGTGEVAIKSQKILINAPIKTIQGSGDVTIEASGDLEVTRSGINLGGINSAGNTSLKGQNISLVGGSNSATALPIQAVGNIDLIAEAAGTAQTIKLNGAATLSAGNNLAIKGLFDGINPATGNRSDFLTATASRGTVQFANNVGSIAPLNAIKLTSGQGSEFKGTTTVAPYTNPLSGAGTITIDSAGSDVVFSGNLSAASLAASIPTNSYTIKLLGATNTFTSTTTPVTLANGGAVFFGAAGAPTTTTFNGGLTLSNNTGANLAGTLFSAAQPLNFGTGTVTLSAASTVDTTNNGAAAGGGAISFGGAVAGAGQSLTIKASSLTDPLDAKEVSFAGGINIGNLIVQPGQYKVSFTGAANTFDQALDFQNKGLVTMGVANNSTNTFTFNNGLAFSGGSAIQMGGIFTTPGQAQNFGLGNPTLIANTTLDTTNASANPAGGDISFGGILSGTYGLTIDAGTGGNVVENQDINGLTSLTLLNANKLEIKGYATIGTFDIQDAVDGISVAGNATINKLLTAAKPYNLSFTGALNEFSKGSDAGGTRVEFNNTANLTLGDSAGGDVFLFDDGFELNGTTGGTGGPAQLFLGGTLKTSGEAIIADLPTTLLASSTIDTTNGGEIKIDGSIDGSTAGTASLNLDTTGAGGKVSLNGRIGGTNALGGLTVVSADQLSLGAAAVISTQGAINLTAANGIETSSTGAAATIASQGGAITLNSPFTLKADQWIDSAGGAISFKAAVSGAGQTLTVDGGNGGSAIFTDNVSLKTLATAAKNYSVSLTGSSNSFTDPVAFSNSGNLTLGDQSTDNFNFQAGPTFPGAQPALTLAGSFSTNGNGFSSGSAITLADNTSIDTTGGTTVGAIISLSGNINGTGKILTLDAGTGGSASLAGDLSLKNLATAAKNYSVSLTGANNSFSDAVAFINSGNITLGDNKSDQFNFQGGLSSSGTGALNLAGVFATNGQAFNANNTGLVTLVQDTSISSGGGAISFAGALSGNSQSLSIDGGNGGSAAFKGNINLKDLITTNKNYTVSFSGAQNTFADLIEFENLGTVTLGSNTGNHTFDFNGGIDLKGNAAIQIGGTINTPGIAQKFGSGSPTLLSNSSLNSTANNNPNGANISLGGNLSGPNFDLTINAGNQGAISENTINLKSLTITNANSLTVAGNATLGNLITGTGTYSIAFNGSSNSFGANGVTPIKFDNQGAVSLGDNSADESLFDTGFELTNNVTALNLAGKILTSGDAVTSKAPITLLTTSSIDTTNKVGPSATGAAITIDGTINATTAGVETLNLTSGQAALTLNGAIGNNKALGGFSVADTAGSLILAATADITADGPVNLSAVGGITSGADITTSGDAVTIGSAYTVSADQTINSAGAAIRFQGAVSGAGQVLTVDGGNGGSATFESTLNLKELKTASNNYSVSLAGSSSFVDAVTFNNTGALSLGDNTADSFGFTGGVIATAPSAISLNGSVSAAGTGLISLGDNDTALNVTGNSSVGGSSSGQISLGNASLADGVTLTAGSGSGAPINLAAVSGSNGGASSNLTINSTGAVNVGGAIGTDIGTVTITNSGGITFANNVNISSLSIANTASYNISFTGNSNSFVNPVDFATSNLVSLGDGGDAFTFTGGLTFSRNAAASIAATIGSSGAAINFGSGGVSLAGDSSVDTTVGNKPSGANISFGGKIDGSTRNINLNAGSGGSISVAGLVNANTLTVTNAAPNSASFSDNVTLTDFITTSQPYSVSFTGSTNSFTNKVVFLNTGKVTLGDAAGSDDFFFNGGLSFSPITPPVPPSATIMIGGKIYTSTATVPAAMEFGNRPIELISTSLLDTTNKGTNTDGGNISFDSTLSGSAFNLSLSAGSTGTINGNGIDAAGAINLKDLTIANAKVVNIAGNLTLSDLITTTNPYNISLLGTSNTITQAVDFANSGTVTLGDDGTDTATPDLFRFLGGLSFSGNAASVLSGVIGSAGKTIDFGSGGVTLQASSRIDTTLNTSPAGAAVSFGADVKGTTSLNEDLTVNAGNGSGSDVTFSGTVGNSSAGGVILGDVVVNTSGATTFTSDVTADSLFTDQPGSAILNGKIAVSPVSSSGTGGVQINELNILINSPVEISSPRGPVVLGGNGGAINAPIGQPNNLTITAGNNQDVSLNGAIGSATAILGDLAINTGGKTLINGSVQALSLVTDPAGTAELNGDIRAAGTNGVAINEAAILIKRDMEITSSQADIVLSNTGGAINSEANEANDLTIKTLNNKNVSLNAAIGAGSNGALGAINVETGGNTLFGSSVKALSLITDKPGSAELHGDISVTGSAGVQILENTLVLNDTTTQMININSTTGDVVLSDTGGTISTPNQTGLIITAGNNKNVSLNAAIGSNTAPFGAIVINTGGHTLLASSVDALSLLTDKPGSAELKGDITTSGSDGVQILEQTLTINNPDADPTKRKVEITSQAGPVTLSSSGGAIDSPNQSDLVVNAGNSDVTLNAAIGGNQELGDIAINTGGATLFNSSVKAASLVTDAPGTASLNGDITLSGPVGAQINEQSVIIKRSLTIDTSTGNGNVTFSGAVDSATGSSNNLTVKAGTGAISLNGPTGGNTLLGNLNLSGGTININDKTQARNVDMSATTMLNFNGDVISPGYLTPGVNYGYQNYSGPFTLLKDVTIEGNIGTIDGTRVYTGTQPVGNFTLSRFYNSESKKADQPDLLPDLPASASNLLTYQLNETAQGQNQSQALAGVGGPDSAGVKGMADVPEQGEVCMEVNDCQSE